MPFITIGSGADLILSLPTIRTQNWNDNYRTSFAIPVSDHDHTGAGKGRLIATAAIAADAVNGSKIRLANNEYLKARNNADDANINMIKVNASDQLEHGLNIFNLNMINNSFISGRNNAGSGNINIIKVNASDKLAIGADLANLAMINNQYIQSRNNADSGYINIIRVNTSDEIEVAVKANMIGDVALKSGKINLDKTFTLADNQSSATNVTGATVTQSTGKGFKLIYGIFIDATANLIEKGEA